MIKGCQKKIIMINDTGSELFDQAYFIIKDTDKAMKMNKNDMIIEANRIIDNNLLGAYFERGKKEKKRTNMREIFVFLLGSVCGVGTVGILWALSLGL